SLLDRKSTPSRPRGTKLGSTQAFSGRDHAAGTSSRCPRKPRARPGRGEWHSAHVPDGSLSGPFSSPPKHRLQWVSSLLGVTGQAIPDAPRKHVDISGGGILPVPSRDFRLKRSGAQTQTPNATGAYWANLIGTGQNATALVTPERFRQWISSPGTAGCSASGSLSA